MGKYLFINDEGRLTQGTLFYFDTNRPKTFGYLLRKTAQPHNTRARYDV